MGGGNVRGSKTLTTSGMSPDDIVKLKHDVSSEVTLTTSYYVANNEIEYEIEVITAECVYGMHFFKDVFSAVRDIVGGRSKAMESTLKDARKTVMAELRKEAHLLGADAVVGVALDYHEVTGGGKNGMLMVVASGTAVKLVEYEEE
jgi:uncharacterized protein YbjQ (UPF0145 family)